MIIRFRSCLWLRPVEIAHQIRPEVIIPVHGEGSGFYIEHLSNSGINIILPSLGETIEV
ncbi:hypothetical protein ACFLWO_00065 [Chloroflexota bacterium]